MRIHLITPTGGRPEALALIVGYMQRQTITDWRWTILDDCDPQTAFLTDPRIEIFRPQWRWTRGMNTQKPNMVALIDHALSIGFDLLFVIEDDEWYAPDYLEEMSRRVVQSDIIIGQTFAHFYNVSLRQGRILPNDQHTALCRTAVTREGAQLMREVFSMQQWPEGTHGDRVLWDRIAVERRNLFTLPRPLNVGIKGMPGRFGLGTGHDRIKRDRIVDQRATLLRKWIGDDVEHYAKYYGRRR